MCTRYHCGQYDHPGRRTSSCTQDIIVVSMITLGVGQAHVHRISISCPNWSNDKSICKLSIIGCLRIDVS